MPALAVLFLLIALVLATPLPSHGQTCPSGCTPSPNGKVGPTSSRVTIGFDAALSADDVAAFRTGVEMWNSYFLANWKDMWFSTSTTGPPQIMIRIDPSDTAGGATNDTNTYGYGTIWVSPRYLNQNRDAYGVMSSRMN